MQASLVWLLLAVVEAATNSTWHAPSNLTTIRQTIKTTRFVTASIRSTRIVTAVGNSTSGRDGIAAPTITPRPWSNASQIVSGPDLGTYHNLTFKTLCTYSDLACYNTCMTGIKACSTEYEIWSKSRDVFQSSMATLLNGGVMPKLTETSTRNASTTTIYSYVTSWDTYLMETTVPAWGAGSQGYTTYTTTVDGTPTTTVAYKSGNFVQTYTASVPYAADKTGTPVSTSIRSPITDEYSYKTSFYSFTQPEPSCGPRSWTACSWSKDCNKCTISGGTVQLLYFPVPRTRPGIQNTTMNATARASPIITQLETATFKGYTLTSPSVYISFQTAYAENDCGSQVGSRYPGAILPMKAGELSSVFGGYGTMWSKDPNIPNFSTPYLIAGSLDLADLEWPYPITAYTNQLQYVLGREIFSIVTSPYNPILAVPPQIRSLDPAWESCALDWEGLYDPPIALSTTDAVVAPTLPPGAEPTEPSPKGPLFLPTAPPLPVPTVMPPAPPTNRPTTPSSLPTVVPDLPAGSRPGDSDSGAGGQVDPGQSIPGGGNSQDPAEQSPGQQNPPSGGQSSGSGGQNSGGQDPGNSSSGQEPAGPSPGGQGAVGSLPSDQDPSNQGSSPGGQSSSDPDSLNRPAVDSPSPTSPGRPPYVFDPPNDNDGTSPGTDPSDPGSSNTQPIAPPNAIVIGSQTLSIGGPAATISNEIISLGSGGIIINSGSQTIPIPPVINDPSPIIFTAGPNDLVLTASPLPVSAPLSTPASTALIPLASTTLTATNLPGRPPGAFILPNPSNGNEFTTLSPGGEALKLPSATISAADNGVILIQGGRTSTIPFTPAEQRIKLESTTLTATPVATGGGAVVVDGVTVSAGGGAVVLGNGRVTVSIGSGGGLVTVGDASTTSRDNSSTTEGEIPLQTAAAGSGGTGRTDLLHGYWRHGMCFVLTLWILL